MTAFPEHQGVRPPGAASADAPPAESAASARDAPLLGSVLIEHGLLNEEQLAAALAEQKGTGAPLGKVLIELGFVEPAVVALALATQSGGVLKTEYGFATGFRPRQEGAPVLEPPLSEPEEEQAAASELRVAQPPPPGETVASQSPAQAPAEAPFPDSPADFAEPLEEAQSDEPAQVEPEAGGQHEVEADPVELAAPPCARPRRTLTIASRQSRGRDGSGPRSRAARDRSAGRDPILSSLRRPQRRALEDLAATASGLAAIEEKTETLLSDLQTIEAETGLALAAERPVPEEGAERDRGPVTRRVPDAGADTAPGELDAAPARITALEAELAAAEEHGRQLRSQVAVLEGELDAAHLHSRGDCNRRTRCDQEPGGARDRARPRRGTRT